MDKIKCQGCTSTTRKEKGCATCGGCGIVYVKQRCGCGRSGWERPYPMTVYDGKHYMSMDGLEWVWHPKGANCIHCEER